jgi:four helix bundle protein
MDKARKDLKDRTKRFALQVIRILPILRKTMEARVIAKQLVRSGTSVGANYREAFRGRSRAEFIAKCGDCLRELEETAYWLELLLETDSASRDRLSAVYRECTELIAIFVTILKHSRDSATTS